MSCPLRNALKRRLCYLSTITWHHVGRTRKCSISRSERDCQSFYLLSMRSPWKRAPPSAWTHRQSLSKPNCSLWCFRSRVVIWSWAFKTGLSYCLFSGCTRVMHWRGPPMVLHCCADPQGALICQKNKQWAAWKKTSESFIVISSSSSSPHTDFENFWRAFMCDIINMLLV